MVEERQLNSGMKQKPNGMGDYNLLQQKKSFYFASVSVQFKKKNYNSITKYYLYIRNYLHNKLGCSRYN